MFDVHYHLIFGVDDGPETIEDSLALAEASIAEGVTHIVATPHANGSYPFQPEVNRERLAILNERLAGRLTLALGCDFNLSYENIVDLEAHPDRYTINSKKYLLVEFADYAIPRSIADVFFRIRNMGIVPIITHPERNPMLLADPARLKEWISTGCLIQITSGSLWGHFGSRSKTMALQLIRRKMAHLVASDAHSVQWRPPSMRKAYEFLREEFSENTADRLCVLNPRAVFYGEHLDSEAEDEYVSPHKRGFFARIFGK